MAVQSQNRFCKDKDQLSKYDFGEKLGEGTYGVVFKATNKLTKEIVAMKKIRIDRDDDGVPSTAIREIALLKGVKHPNIVELKEVIYSREELWLVFEYCEFDLKKYMRSRGNVPLPKDKAMSFLFQILHALIHLH
jgi:serine/threonine protein kinase